ncbi:RNA helicase, putative [Bodo saltans]|nr:RNA helicase, putative [Bodo saltans]|eukprot:CUG93740.1 RNA helicase, putative [Bodo saltans]
MRGSSCRCFHLLNATCNTIYRSAQCRSRLSTTLLENSIESALDEMELFRQTHVHTFDDRKLQPLAAHERIDVVMKAIEEWYLDTRASDRLSLSEPWLWYSKARSMRRSFVFHYGPTNSGKTHDALDALVSAKNGVYCAPLKALATQVFYNIQNRGVSCDLLIGDERKFGGSAEHVSCTVEMTPLDFQVDIGVIDEVQLIGDRDRGWAWTRALLGLPARQIHLCGEARALPLIKKLLSLTGEIKRLQCVEHKRLVPLVLTPSLDSQLSRLDNGDCVVCFSKKAVLDNYHRLKTIPDVYPHVVYGALPFRVRERQGQAFNDGVMSSSGKKHVLISTDAIAYGLNMNIRRVILTTVRKFDGRSTVEIPHATTLQIIGRAGRFGHAFSTKGFATTLHSKDYWFLKRCIDQPVDDLTTAGVLPTADIIILYARLLERRGHPVEGLHSLLTSLLQEMKLPGLLFLCDLTRSLMRTAECLDTVEGLTLPDKVVFSFVPLSDNSHATMQLLRQYATHHARGEKVPLHLDRASDHEWVYKMCEAYCWLGWRFRQTFCFIAEGEMLKDTVSRSIGDSI